MFSPDKFRPVNMTPQQFLRPPTEPLQHVFSKLALLQEMEVNKTATDVAMQVGLSTKNRPSAPLLRIGSEFEIILFSKKSNPREDRLSWNNPNYSDKHTSRIRDFRELLLSREAQGGLRDVLYNDASFAGRITAEIRTPPADVKGYKD